MPGHTLVVYDPDSALVTDILACEDAYESECTGAATACGFMARDAEEYQPIVRKPSSPLARRVGSSTARASTPGWAAISVKAERARVMPV